MSPQHQATNQTEMPEIRTSTYSSSFYTPTFTTDNTANTADLEIVSQQRRRVQLPHPPPPVLPEPVLQPKKEKVMPETPATRIVQVFVADPDTRIPVEKRLLHRDDQPKLTESTNDELYFEIPIKQLLDAHNEYRKGVLDKKASARSGRDIYLEEIKIRDLRMVVAEIAGF